MSDEENEVPPQTRFAGREVKHYLVKNNYAPPAESFLAESKNSWTSMTHAFKFLSLEEATKIAHGHEGARVFWVGENDALGEVVNDFNDSSYHRHEYDERTYG